ncbi:MAG: hypothetical protein ACXWVZ_01305 [Kaistella sp.]
MRKYQFLGVAAAVIYFFQSFFLATGGIGADSLSYFGIASDLPKLETNLFPLGFPFLIEVFHSIFQDYFWAGKMLNFAMVIIILLFSYFKKFYFRETVLLFAGKTLFFALNLVVSEGPFIFLLYFLIYFFHERLQEKIDSRSFIFSASIILILLFTVRYSGIYIYLGIGIFWMLMVFKKVTFPAQKDFLWVLMISGLGIGAYLGFNHAVFGSFTGEHLRGAPAQIYPVYLLRNVFAIANVIDPFIGIKPASNGFLSIAFQAGLMIFDLILLRYFITLFREKKRFLQLEFHYLLWTIAGVYTVTLFISGLFQQIEELNVRMLAAANFFYFFSFLVIYFKNLKSDVLIFRLGSFFLLFLTVYSLKSPENYLKNKRIIEPQMSKFQGKKYLFDDEKTVKNVTEYHIPVINKSFTYKHTNSQKGEWKQSIAGTINPQIKWLKYDTIKDKKQVLYTSELFLK